MRHFIFEEPGRAGALQVKRCIEGQAEQAHDLAADFSRVLSASAGRDRSRAWRAASAQRSQHGRSVAAMQLDPLRSQLAPNRLLALNLTYVMGHDESLKNLNTWELMTCNLQTRTFVTNSKPTLTDRASRILAVRVWVYIYMSEVYNQKKKQAFNGGLRAKTFVMSSCHKSPLTPKSLRTDSSASEARS